MKKLGVQCHVTDTTVVSFRSSTLTHRSLKNEKKISNITSPKIKVSKIESFYHSFGAIALEKQISIHVISIYFQSLKKYFILF